MEAIRSFRVIMFVYCWLAMLPVAHAYGQNQDFLLSKAVLVDPSAQLTIDEVAVAQFSPLDGVLAAGFTEAVHWLRLDIRPRIEGAALKIRIRPTFLDDVQLFQRDDSQPSGWRRWQDGDGQVGEGNATGLNSLGFLIHPQLPSSVYYLRLQTTSTSFLDIEVLAPPQAAAMDLRLALWNFLYLALILWVVLWGIYDFYWYRQRVVGLFVFYQLSNALYVFFVMGYGALLFDEEFRFLTDEFTSVSIFVMQIFALIFHGRLLAAYEPPQSMLLVMRFLIGLVVALLLLYFWGLERLALQINVQVALASSLVISLLPFLARKEGIPSLRYVRSVYAIFCLAQLSYLLPFLGVSDALDWTLQWPLVHGFLTTILMFYMLQHRSRMLRREMALRAQQVRLAAAQLEQERNYTQALSRFVDMLTHEIKTPLAVAVMNLGAMQLTGPYMDRARRALSNIDEVVERARLSELTENGRLEPRLFPVNLSELLYECVEDCPDSSRVSTSIEYSREVVSDAGLLKIIVKNLIDNALKYSPPGTKVFVAMKCLGSHQLVSVVNQVDAAGIPDVERVFDKFYRGASSYSKSGSGLGLYLSNNLAQLLGASLRLESGNREVEFQLWLPT